VTTGQYDRHNNPNFWEGRRKASVDMRKKGIKPCPASVAGSIASRRLKLIGTTKEESPELYKRYQEYWLKKLEERDGASSGSVDSYVPEPSGAS